MKQVLSLIVIALILVSGYLCFRISGKIAAPEQSGTGAEEVPGITRPPRKNNESTTLQSKRSESITRRNLFHVDVFQRPKPDAQRIDKAAASQQLKKTDLQLILWGTVTGTGDIYAVIEDKKTREQSLYQVGDTVQAATIKKITRHQVVLAHHGEDRVLEMASDVSARPGSEEPPVTSPDKNAIRPTQQKAPVEVIAVIDSPPEAGQLKNQIRFRPRFTNGSPDGLLVYGIRADSVYAKLGLKNGDILTEFNSLPMAKPEDMEKLFNGISPDSEGSFKVVRRGRPAQINYKIRRSQ